MKKNSQYRQLNKKNKLRSLKISGLVRYFITLFISAAILGVLFLILLFPLRAFTKSVLSIFFSSNIIKLMADNLVFFIILGFLLVFIIISVYTIIRAFRYVDIVHDAIGKVSDYDNDISGFPEELKAIEVALKDVQYSIFRNEQHAKEAEQRKNDLVVYLAHDLKTPLTSIIGYLSLLNEAQELPMEQKAKYVNITLDKAYRLESLINEFFDITRFNLHSVVLENNRIDLTLMLHQMADEFYPVLIQRSLNIKTQIEQGLVLIADADKLARILDNLLRNAINYSYENMDILLAASQRGNEIIIVVRNRGDEIPRAKIEQIFEKFFRLDDARNTATGGAGLGLAIVKQLVELHHGVVEVKSSREYTDFIVRLPCAAI